MILGALKDYYDRMAEKDAASVAPAGYSDQPISFAVLLSVDGEVLDLQDLRDRSGKKPLPSSIPVPRPVKRTSGIASNFLWDKTAYALGVKRGPDKKTMIFAEREHAAFKTLHEERLAGTNDPGLQALLAFLRSWNPAEFGRLPEADAALDTNIVFRLDDGTRELLHGRPAAWDLAARSDAEGTSDGAASGLVCLVTGAPGAIERLHPAIKGVQDAQSSGASIVSFNLDAFTSYGKSQGDNAPVSKTAALAYTEALNGLLRRGSRNRVQIGDATVAFWAEAPPQAAAAADMLMGLAFDPPRPSDEGEAAKVRDVLDKIEKGRPLEEVDPKLHDETRYFVLGLSPNAARISVRFWHQGTLGELACRFRQHWDNLLLEPRPWRTPPALRRLLYETAVLGKRENVAPHLAGEVMRSILTGRRYPRTLLVATILRMRAEQSVNGLRAAIVKACLVREGEKIPVSLDRSESNPGYRLGRLFAVLELTQRAALRQVNATIRDRYYGAASATPASVFPMILRTSGHHLSSLRKTGRGGLAHWFEREVADIVDGLGSTFPRNLRIEDQGRFAIGYYHEREALHRRKDGAPAELAEIIDKEDDSEEEAEA